MAFSRRLQPALQRPPAARLREAHRGAPEGRLPGEAAEGLATAAAAADGRGQLGALRRLAGGDVGGGDGHGANGGDLSGALLLEGLEFRRGSWK